MNPIDVFTKVTFRPMDKHDLEAFAGIEYDGYIGELGGLTIVMDHGPGGMHVEVYNEEAERVETWHFDVTDQQGRTVG